MGKDHILPREHGLSRSSSRSVLFARLLTVLFYVFIAVTALAIFIPLNPRMPSKGLDASWEFAMNEAVARHMTFGKQIMFTYGPYASIGTRVYSPATDLRMMWGSTFIAFSYLAGLSFMARGKGMYLIIILFLFLTTFGHPELLLVSYAFLLATCALKYLNPDDGDKPAKLNWRQGSVVVVMWSTLGLLPLVKGSLLLPFAATVTIPPALFIYHRRIKQAMILLLLPIISSIGLWIYAGQPLGNLPAFLRGTFQLTSGYTEAMSSSWVILPGIIGDGLVIVFVVVSALICWSICRSTRLPVSSKWTFITLCALFLLVIFKHGFVKADAISGVFPALAALFLIAGFLQMDKFLIWSLTIAMILTVGTSAMQDSVLFREVHERFGSGISWSGEKRADIFAFCTERAAGAYSRTTYKSTWNTLADAGEGLRSRLSRGNELEARYARAIDEIRSDNPLPPLKGSTDIYEYEQSVLLASNDEWDPRPVFQSYSVYTPTLARLNERHLRGQDAPDWVLFDLQGIGGRFPSLDDGASWPALLDNFTFDSYDGKFVLMHRKPSIQTYSKYGEAFRQTCQTGATITLPAMDGPVFAEVDLKPTLAGRLLIALFNPPQLQIVAGLRSGKIVRYRTVSSMMETGFFISPLISNTKDFATLMSGSKDVLGEDDVKSISISPLYGGSIFWSDTYQLILKKYVGD